MCAAPRPPEPVEDPGQLIGGDTGPGVADLQDGFRSRRGGPHGDPAPGERELQRVGEQVGDDLMKPARVREHLDRGKPPLRVMPAASEPPGQAVRGAVGDPARSCLLSVSCSAAASAAAESAGRRPSGPAAAPHPQGRELPGSRLGHPVQQRLVTGLQDRDRGPQLVGDVGDQIAAELLLPVRVSAIRSKAVASSPISPGAEMGPTRAARSPRPIARVTAISRSTGRVIAAPRPAR
jgi:hypothetical protein